MKNSKPPSYTKATVIGVIFFFVLAIPTIIVGGYYYQKFDNQLTQYVYSERATVASLSAVAIERKIEQLAGITNNIASDPSVESDVQQGNWVAAKNDLKNLWDDPANYNYYIDRVKFLSTQGVTEAAYPGVLSTTTTTIDAAFGEWQVPIVQQGAPWFMSDVYLGKNSGADYVELIVPVKNAQSQVIGAVASQIYTNSFSDFGKDVDIGSDGFAYFVDRDGNIVTHPKYSSNGPVVSYASVPAVQAVMAGQSGVGLLYNPIENVERVAAYTQVPQVGWGVVAQEPSQEAFVNRDSILNQILHVVLVLCCVELLGAVLIFWLLAYKKKPQRRK